MKTAFDHTTLLCLGLLALPVVACTAGPENEGSTLASDVRGKANPVDARVRAAKASSETTRITDALEAHGWSVAWKDAALEKDVLVVPAKRAALAVDIVVATIDDELSAVVRPHDKASGERALADLGNEDGEAEYAPDGPSDESNAGKQGVAGNACADKAACTRNCLPCRNWSCSFVSRKFPGNALCAASDFMLYEVTTVSGFTDPGRCTGWYASFNGRTVSCPSPGVRSTARVCYLPGWVVE